MDVKKGQEIELTIQALAYGGKGISRYDNFVIFVDKSIPGQKVLAYVYKKKKDYAEARVKKFSLNRPILLTPSVSIFQPAEAVRHNSYPMLSSLTKKRAKCSIFSRGRHL